jgi:ribonucleoside-diphosphate reductase alpha chain
VIRMHRASVNNIGASRNSSEPFVAPQLDEMIAASKDAWDGALAHGEKHGYRNSQVTVLAPTGTIGFMMDCDTTGIEPDLALVKYKKLVGGGMIKIVNGTVPSALFKLGYNNAEVDAIVSYIDATGTIEGAPAIKDEHLACFDCSFKPAKGTRTIHYMGHIKMMGATQPFLSGAISKTVNLPNDCTVDDIAEAYTESWRQGLKAVAIYRDGSKGTQPLNVSSDHEKKAAKPVLPGEVQVASAEEQKISALEAQVAQLSAALSQNADAHGASAPPRAVRHRLPEERASVTHKFSLSGHEGYITVGLYPNGAPGEIFIRMAKEGSTISGLMDSFATAISIALQHGVPLKVLVEKFAHTRFEPSGWTGNEQIGYAKSIMDYIFRWLQLRFLSGQQLDLFVGLATAAGTGHAPSLTASAEVAAPAAALPLRDMGATSAPQQGIAPEVRAVSSQETPVADAESYKMEDRGIYHVADAMKEMFNMGDAPSCATCGAIMTRNGSCYRCMSCGNTSGCS